MEHRVIVGYDGSAASVNALRWAANEAELRGASVGVLSSYALPRVLEFGHGPATAIWNDPDMAEWTRRQMAEAVDAAFDRHPTVPRDIEAVNVRPATALLRAAESADLVAVGRSGAGAVGNLVLGSVTSELLAASSCPVAVTPSTTSAAPQRILVGTDGSSHATRAVEWAAREADLRRCELLVVHAWSPPLGAAGGRDADADLVLDGALEMARRLRGSVVEGELVAGQLVAGQLVEGGAARALLELSGSAELVVVGSRGRGGFRSMLFGSVAHAIAAHAACPAVVVR